MLSLILIGSISRLDLDLDLYININNTTPSLYLEKELLHNTVFNNIFMKTSVRKHKKISPKRFQIK